MRLIVEDGYNRGAELPLVGDRVRLGRGEECELQLLDEGVSRTHAELTRDGERLRIRDLSSRNGVRVNGVPVEATNLIAGDRITLGGVRLLLLPDPADAPPSPRPSFVDRPTQELNLAPDPALRVRPGRARAPELLGECAGVLALLKQIAKVAAADATVLVQGESGTGKELIARALHRLSPRRRGPFVVLNCAALPTELVESELFGHEKGAFTGALARKIGLAEAADGGTLFLDEVGELPPAAQAKLLRFLENRELTRVGSTHSLKVDVRLVAATHRDLEAMVKDEAFREDLLYRLRVVELTVPPLRERGEDVVLLAERFLEELSPTRRTFTPAALATVRGYAWPGNVRELRNAIESAVILAEGESIDASDLPARIRGVSTTPASGEPVTLKEAEKRAILAALAHHDGHRTQTADALGIDRKTLYSKLKDLGLSPS